ncbi:MAG: hypothetical protein D3922_14155, partial [Candidatus Electrothrix sp. AR1]|nr:hypothetical protein [Candidatus Electrothrix sp. AR1]
AEAWIRHENGGAVGFTGAARISYSYYNDAFLVGLMDSFWDDYSSSPNSYGAVTSYPLSFRPAEALTRAKAFVLAATGSGNTSYGTLTARLFNWFGDPEQAMRTETPLALSAVHPDFLEVGLPANFDVAVTRDGSLLSNAQVAIVMDPGYFYVVQTDNSGKAHFSFTPTATGTMSVTVSEQNSIPYEGIIDVKNVDKPPVAQCKKNTVLNLDPSGQAVLTPGQVDDGSYDPEGQKITYSLSKKNFNCSDVGGVPQPVILTVTDEDELEDQCLSNVTVVDNLPPVPDMTPLPQVTGECSATVTATPTATDNCAGSVTGSTNNPLSYSNQGTHTVTWSFDDGNGNTSTQTQQVVVDDNTPPSVQTQNITVQLAANGQASITASQIDNGSSDACGIASLSVDPLSFTCAEVGANPVT